MKFKLLISLLSGVLLIPGTAQSEFAYTGFDVSYVDVEAGNLDGDGYRFAGDLSLTEHFFLLGSWEERDFGAGIDGSALELGGGFNHTVNPDLDIVVKGSYIDADVDGPGPGSLNDDGLGVAGGVRTRLGGSFQLAAMLRWVDMDRGGSDTGVELSGRYYFRERFAVGLKANLDDDVDSISIGFRADF
ncbi:MAG TPA: hypothetical protein VIV14_07065 [Gammaproteobacteria bacterium]